MENQEKLKMTAPKPDNSSSLSKIPTLKYLVSQSIEGRVNTKEVHEETKSCNNAKHGNLFPKRGAIITEAPIPPAGATKKDPNAGSGDIATSITNYLNTQAEVDVGNLIAAAYEKGSALLQAGAELAYQIFSDDHSDGTRRALSKERRAMEARRRDNVVTIAATHVNEVRKAPSCLQQSQQKPRILTAKARDISSSQGLSLIQSAAASIQRKTSSVSTGPLCLRGQLNENNRSDDTAYYNGYSIRVRGNGVTLDTMHVNGSGPSKRAIEIRIRLDLPPPRPGLYGHLTREYGGPHSELLLLRYVHGEVTGIVELTCPPHVQPQALTAEINSENLLVITAP